MLMLHQNFYPFETVKPLKKPWFFAYKDLLVFDSSVR